MLRSALLALVGLSMAACATTAGNFESDRFQSSSYPYAIRYASAGGEKMLASPDWRVDNYSQSTYGKRWTLKKGPEYWVERAYDYNDDGVAERKRKEPFYDLRLEHRERDASLWVRVVPISRGDERKFLRVFAERYVESAAGSGSVAVHFGTEATYAVSRRYASRVLSTSECTVGGKPAQLLDFEVANIEQLELSSDARWSRSRLAIIRPGYRTPKGTSESGRFPVLILVGLSASPTDFEAVSADFDALLSRVALGEPEAERDAHASFKAGSSCQVAAVAPSSPTGTVPASSGADAVPVPSDGNTPAEPSTPATTPSEAAPGPSAAARTSATAL